MVDELPNLVELGDSTIGFKLANALNVTSLGASEVIGWIQSDIVDATDVTTSDCTRSGDRKVGGKDIVSSKSEDAIIEKTIFLLKTSSVHLEGTTGPEALKGVDKA
jgi:hypothetical protein